MTIGAALRARGITHVGLWRDDAWVAMSARESIGTAARMGVSAPGFYLLERSWILLHTGSTAWDQIPPFAMGMACIPAIFLLTKYFKFDAWIGLGVSLMVAVGPTTLTYATRLKEYEADFLLACLLLTLAEGVRRRPDICHLTMLAAISVVSFFISASTGPVIVGVWCAIVLRCLLDRRRLGSSIAMATSTAAGCLLVFEHFYRDLPPSDSRSWVGFYFDFGSPHHLISSVYNLILRVDTHMTGVSLTTTIEGILFFLLMAGLVVVGVFRDPRMLSAGLVLGAALVACAAKIIPLGTGRTDVVLYPALLILLASGLQVAMRWAGSHAGTTFRLSATIGLVGLLFAASLIVDGARFNNRYPGVDTKALATSLGHHIRLGDEVVVDELMRYPWGLYEEQNLDLKFGMNWSAGFTVISSTPHTFIAPSEGYEGGSEPNQWAQQLSHYRRLWFVESPPLQLSPLYASLRKAGWRPTTTLRAAGCAAILMVRNRP